MGQKPLQGQLVVDDELCALGLTDAAERPGAVDRELLVDYVRAYFERRRVALADEADPAPHRGALDRVDSPPGLAGAVPGGLGAFTVRQVLDRLNRLGVLRVDSHVGAELLRQLKAFWREVDSDD